MNLIAFDTSTEWTTVALSVDGVVQLWQQQTPQQHAKLLLGVIDRLLAEAGIGRSMLDGIAFGRGPGSFTGVRLATAVAQGLSFGLDRPAVPVSTLAALAHAAGPQAGGRSVLALLDARMGELYAGLFEVDGDRVVAQMPEQVVAPGRLTLPVAGPVLVCGGGYTTYAAQLPETLRGVLVLADLVGTQTPGAVSIARLATLQLVGGCLDAPVPVYLRDRVALTEAERRVVHSPAAR